MACCREDAEKDMQFDGLKTEDQIALEIGAERGYYGAYTIANHGDLIGTGILKVKATNYAEAVGTMYLRLQDEYPVNHIYSLTVDEEFAWIVPDSPRAIVMNTQGGVDLTDLVPNLVEEAIQYAVESDSSMLDDLEAYGCISFEEDDVKLSKQLRGHLQKF